MVQSNQEAIGGEQVGAPPNKSDSFEVESPSFKEVQNKQASVYKWKAKLGGWMSFMRTTR